MIRFSPLAISFLIFFFFSSTEQDRHFRNNKLETKDNLSRVKVRRALTLMSNIPIEHRNIRELYKERTRVTDCINDENNIVVKKEKKYNSEQSNALKGLKGKKKIDTIGDEEEKSSGKNVNFQDVQEKRVQNLSKSLLIFDELFEPDVLWNYVDTYNTGTDIRNYEFDENKQPSSDDLDDGLNTDWLCTHCDFANLLTDTVCAVCNMKREEELVDDDLALNIARAPWITKDALKIPFRPLIEIIYSCEDQRKLKFRDRDLFVDMSRSNTGELACAVCVFFEFGRVVSMSSSKEASQTNQEIWDTNKTKVQLRKQPPLSKIKIVNGRKKKRKKKRKNVTVASCWFQGSTTWFDFTKYAEMSVGLMNLTSLPELGYTNYPIESTKWRATMQETCSVLENRLIECLVGTYFVIVSKVLSGTVKIMGWIKVEEIRYKRDGFDVVMELFERNDGESDADADVDEEQEGLDVLSQHFGRVTF